jgi:hypothetical protein
MLDSIPTKTPGTTGSAEIHFFRAATRDRRADKRTQHMQLNTGTEGSQTFTPCNEIGNRRKNKQNTGLQNFKEEVNGENLQEDGKISSNKNRIGRDQQVKV